MNRRQLLRSLGAASVAGAASIAAMQPRPWGEDQGRDRGDMPTVEPPKPGAQTEEPDDPPETEPAEEEESADPDVRYADAYGTVVQAVEAGADPEGESPINPILETHADEDTLVSFPPGTYRLRPLKLAGRDNLAIAAAGEERPTFKAPPDICLGTPYIEFDRMSNFLVDGIDFDFTAKGAGGGFKITADGDASVANLRLRGSCQKQVAAFRMDVLDQDSSGLVKNLEARYDGDRKLTGMFVGKGHQGEVTFEDCQAVGFSDNGLYASAPGASDGGNGTVHTVGGHYENNNISNVRLGTTGSSARDVTVRANSVPPGDAVNVRGIRLRDRQGQLVENCTISFGPDAGESFGAIVFHPDNGGATIRNTHVDIDTPNVPAVHAFAPNRRRPTAPLFDDVTITGDATGTYAVTLYGRDGATFENCRIKQRGEGRRGIRLKSCTGCRIVDSYIDASLTPIVARKSSVLVENTIVATPDGERKIHNDVFEDEIIRPR